jgi:hypothetical protein
MGRSAFPGYPAFLELAAGNLGVPNSVARGSPPRQLATLANLCAQASTAEPGHKAMILAEARILRDGLIVAAGAAELMIADVSPYVPKPEAVDLPKSTWSANRPTPSRP